MKDSIKQEYSKAMANIFGLQGLPMMANLLMVKEMVWVSGGQPTKMEIVMKAIINRIKNMAKGSISGKMVTNMKDNSNQI